tara:strand:+ start:6277 stop:12678 length:6402 start_codon:yes stop_codon:yes gene_type:complete
VSQNPENTDRVSTVKLALMARNAREKIGATLAADPIAIVGMGCRFPGGSNTPEDFWSFLLEKRNVVSGIPSDRWDADKWYSADPDAPGLSIAAGAAFLDSVDTFDAGYFGIPAREADQMDPQQRIFLEVAIEALEDAGLRFEDLRRSRTGVFIASYHNDYAQMLYRDPASMDQRTLTGTLHSVLANRLSYLLDLKGPSISVDTACSSSLVAVHMACQSLRTGESNLALAGGVSVILAPELMVSMSRLGFLAPDGKCKTFDASADGFGRGEGCGVIALKRLSDAIADGDRIWSVIRGSAVNQDGESTLLAAPNVHAQAALVREAVVNAQVHPDDVVYVETHGTGTILGDPIEVDALAETVGTAGPNRPDCLLGSVKANIGHLEAGAGIAGIIKTSLVLSHKQVPGQPGFTKLNPHITLDRTRLKIAEDLQALPATTGTPAAGVSSFGVGGTNAHIVLEAAPNLKKPAIEESAEQVWTLPLSARSPEALKANAASWKAWLDTHATPLADICFTASQRRSHQTYRMAVSASSRDALAQKLAERMDKVVEPAAPNVCFVFCGQGPQQAKMGLQLAESEPLFAKHLQRCDAILLPLTGWSLIEELSREDSASRLNETAFAQPALTALQTGLVALLQSWGLSPNSVTGHSVGEIAAMEAAGLLSLEEALRIAAHRGRIMQKADGTGAMASVSLDEIAASEAIAPYDDALSIAAVNAPNEIVVSGDMEALGSLLSSLDARSVNYRRLPVRYAFHSEQMAPFKQELVDTLGEVKSTPGNGIQTISTITGKPVSQIDAAHFARGIRAPVLFSNAIKQTAQGERTIYVEIGPHPVLSASIAATLENTEMPDAPIVPALRRGRADRDILGDCVARLFEAGSSPNWAALQPKGNVVSLPPYAWQRKRYWRDVAAAEPGLAGLDTGHPLLGHRLTIASNDLAIFQGSAARSRDWLKDHKILGQTIVPGTAMVEILAAAAKQLAGPGARLEDFSISAPLPCFRLDGSDAQWQVIAQRNNSEWLLQLHLISNDETAPLPHPIAEATARDHPDSPSEQDPRTDPATLTHSLSDSDIETSFQKIGAEFGPAFRLLSNVRIGERVATGRINLPSHLLHAAHCIHPSILDAGLQLCSLIAGNSDTAWLPVAVRTAILPAHTSLFSLTAEARLQESSDTDGLLADVIFRNEAGDTVATLEGIRFAPASRQALAASLATPVELYTTGWYPIELQSAKVAESWLIISGNHQEQAKALAAGKDNARIISTADPEALDKALDWLSTAPEPRQVMDLSSLDTDDAIAVIKTGLAHVQCVASRDASIGYASISRGAFQTGQEHSAPSISGRALQGFASTAALEHPELEIHCLDIDPDTDEGHYEQVSEAVCGAVCASGPVKLALRDGKWFAPRLAPAKQLESDAPLALCRPGDAGIDSLMLRKTPRALLENNSVRIAVRAAGLNFRDVLSTLGMLPGAMPPLGVECAGEVIETGAAVTALRPGDRVFGYAPGAIAEEVTAPANWMMPIPSGMSDQVAAGLTVTFGTALYGLDRLAKLKKGESVLIHAGAGGVGLAAIKIALARGADIFTTAGSQEKRDMLKAIGASHVFDSRSLEFENQVLDATNGQGVDVVLNSLSGAFIPASVRCLSDTGRFLEIGKRDLMSLETFQSMKPSASYHVYDLGQDIEAGIAHLAPLLSDVLDGLQTGHLSPLPVRTFGLDQAAEAMRFMAAAKHTGKIVLRVPPRRKPVIHADASYLITGGLGGLGLYTAKWLTSQSAKHIVLTGRSSPNDKAKDMIAEIEATGANVHVFQADIGDKDAVAALLAKISDSLPPLKGIVHAAGALRDGPVMTRTPEDVDIVAQGKLRGAMLLDQMTRDLSLDFFVLYSAAGASLGAPGQSLYAAANYGLDALAAARHRDGFAALSVAWGFWKDAGMGARLAESGRDTWSTRGLGAITPENGFPVMETLLASENPAAMAAKVDWAHFLKTAPKGIDLSMFDGLSRDTGAVVSNTPSSSAAHALHDQLAGLSREALEAELRRIAENAARSIIGMDDSEEIGRAEPLKDLGLDSLMAVELRNDLARTLGLRLSATLLFDYPTIDRLCHYLSEQFSPTLNEKPGSVGDDTDDLDHLSDKELAELLEAELNASDVGQKTEGGRRG